MDRSLFQGSTASGLVNGTRWVNPNLFTNTQICERAFTLYQDRKYIPNCFYLCCFEKQVLIRLLKKELVQQNRLYLTVQVSLVPSETRVKPICKMEPKEGKGRIIKKRWLTVWGTEPEQTTAALWGKSVSCVELCLLLSRWFLQNCWRWSEARVLLLKLAYVSSEVLREHE